ncbi:MAG TPA: hypothetical protein VM942_05570 [Acidimicrobiales bacterium]|nr:hypothetical protein [Acidimicrobiales bacterium]
MRTNRRRWWFVMGVAAVVLTTACGGGGGARSEAAGVTRQATTTTAAPTKAPPTSAPPSTTPPAGGATKVTETTVARPQAPVTTAPRAPHADPVVVRCDPVYVNELPQVTATPSRAPSGARVELDGCGFTGDPWQTDGGALWLSAVGGQDTCSLMAEADNDVRVTADGYLTGGFTVPATGVCRFSADEEMSTAGLDFQIAYQCTACHIGTFTVIISGESEEEPIGARCNSVAFMGGENVAGEVHADGIPCGEAEAFISAHASAWGPVNGPAHVEADGFTCDRTGQSDVHLPRANYKCTRGAQTIWFVRT